MSKWRDNFCSTWGNTSNLKRVTNQLNREVYNKKIDRRLSEVVAGNWVRKGKKINPKNRSSRPCECCGRYFDKSLVREDTGCFFICADCLRRKN